eukprot:COSAG05_NODE_13451_length_430_cov_0.619335_1_plen_64_part_01
MVTASAISDSLSTDTQRITSNHPTQYTVSQRSRGRALQLSVLHVISDREREDKRTVRRVANEHL